MTSSENGDDVDSKADALAGFKPKSLEEIRDEHGLSAEWEPRFAADTPRAEEKAEEYEAMGFDAEVFPHPDDVSRGQMPGRGDRCVVYTRERDEDDSEGGFVDDDIF